MVSEGTKKLQIIIEEFEDAVEAYYKLEDLWYSTNWPNYKFAVALHEFVESKHNLTLGFTSLSAMAGYMDIPDSAVMYVQRIYRELTLKRNIPVTAYEHLDMVKTNSLMSRIDECLDGDLNLNAVEIGAQKISAIWRVWIDGALDTINSRAGASNLGGNRKGKS